MRVKIIEGWEGPRAWEGSVHLVAGTELHVGPGPTRPATRRGRRRDAAADTRSVAGRPGPRTRRSINRRDAVRRRRRHRARRSIGRRCGGVAAGCATTAFVAALAGDVAASRPAARPPRSSQHWPARRRCRRRARRSIGRRRCGVAAGCMINRARRSIGRRDLAQHLRRHRARRRVVAASAGDVSGCATTAQLGPRSVVAALAGATRLGVAAATALVAASAGDAAGSVTRRRRIL